MKIQNSGSNPFYYWSSLLVFTLLLLSSILLSGCNTQAREQCESECMDQYMADTVLCGLAESDSEYNSCYDRAKDYRQNCYDYCE